MSFYTVYQSSESLPFDACVLEACIDTDAIWYIFSNMLSRLFRKCSISQIQIQVSNKTQKNSVTVRTYKHTAYFKPSQDRNIWIQTRSHQFKSIPHRVHSDSCYKTTHPLPLQPAPLPATGFWEIEFLRRDVFERLEWAVLRNICWISIEMLV